MPINGMGDWERLQRLGFVRRGVKEEVLDERGKPVLDPSGQPKTKPKATEYFIVPDEVKEVLGEEKPTRLPIYFLLDLDKALSFFLMLYSGNGKLRCMGDGESVWYRRYIDVKEKHFQSLIYNRVAKWSQITEDIGERWTQEYGSMERYGGDNGNTVRCLYRECPRFGPKGCKPTGMLRFGIKDIPRQGYYQMTVHQNGLIDLLSQLRWARDIVEQYLGEATIMHVPFWLTLVGPERIRVNNYVTNVWTPRAEIEPDWLQRAMEGRVRLPHRPQIRLMDIYAGNGAELPMPVPEEELDVTPEVLEDLDYNPNGDEEDASF